jgi:hypothetical protein
MLDKKTNLLATIGCSHSSDYVGKSWPIFLADSIGLDLLQTYSSGAGNEMNLEKVHLVLEKNPKLVIIQLTDPARYTVGINKDSSLDPNMLTECHYANGCSYYTFNSWNNIDNLKQLTGKSYHKDVDNFIINDVILSNYNLNYKILHTISAMAFMCHRSNVPVVFFSWSVDIHKIILECGYTQLFESLNIIPGYIEQFVKERKLIPKKNDGHHEADNQKIICNEYILPYLIDRGLV